MFHHRYILIALFLCISGLALSQESFNESRGLGFHAGVFYWSITNDLLLEPGLQFKYEKNLFRVSNEFLLYKGQTMESSLALNYRRYPLRNDGRLKFFLSGELKYLHTEGYYTRTRRVSGVFAPIGTGIQITVGKGFNLGIEAAWGPGYVSNSTRFENNTIIYKSDFAFTLSYALSRLP